MNLTDRFIESQKPNGKDQKFSDSGARGAGILYFRITKAGHRCWLFRYSNSQGKQIAISFADYDRKGTTGLSLTQARARAADFSRLYQSGIKDIREHLEAEQEAIRAEREAAEAARLEAVEQARRGSLKALIGTYLDSLDSRGKSSANATRFRLTKHVIEAWPELVKKQAATVTTAEIRDVLARMVDAGITRETNLVRAGLNAAYQIVLRAQYDPTLKGNISVFGIEANPVSVIPVLTQFNSARERSLTWGELGAYLKRVVAINNPVTRDLLLLALYAGGQRVIQVAKLRESDVDWDADTFTLKDPKGRRTKVRDHMLPMTDLTREILSRRKTQAMNGWLFTHTGNAPLNSATPSHAVTDICRAMQAAGECTEHFQMSDIRRSCETRQAEMGISEDLRAQLQSHGLAGVQNRHYNKYRYLDEKRQVLEAWEARLQLLDMDNVVDVESKKVND